MSPRPAVDPRFGQRMRAIRQLRGLSLRALEGKTQSNRSSLSEYERAQTLPSQETAQLIDTALGANGELVAALRADAREVFTRPAVWDDVPDDSLWTPSATATMVSIVTRKDLAMDRRQAIRGATGVLVGTPLLERLERWLLDSHRPAPGLRGTGIGHEEVEQIEAAARVFRSWDNNYGGGLMRKAVVGQLNEVADELRDHAHAERPRRRLFGAMAQLASTAAMMSWDSGHGATAQRYHLLALRAAKEAGDRAFGANVLAGMARQLLYLNSPADALEMIRLAQAGTDGHATPRVRAMLYTREAWAYAAQHRVEAFRRTTGRAEDALAEADQGHEDPYWIGYFDGAELAGTTGGRLLDLSHHERTLAGETAARIETAIRARQGLSLRSKALDAIGLAEARLVQGEMEEAARLGFEAASIVEQTRSDRVRVKLEEFVHCTDRHAAHPSIAQLRPYIRELAANN